MHEEKVLSLNECKALPEEKDSEKVIPDKCQILI